MKRLSISFLLFVFFVLIILLAQGLFAQTPPDDTTGVSINTTYTVPAGLHPGTLTNGTTYDMYLLNQARTTIIGSNLDFVYDDTTGNVLSVITGLDYNTTYSWGVWADGANPLTDTVLYGYFDFTTEIASPVLTFPLANATGVSVLPNITWTYSGGTTGVTFDVELSTDAGTSWNDVVTGLPGTTTNYTFTTALTYNFSDYVVRIRAKKTGEPDKTSSENNFTTVLATPSLSSPSNGASFLYTSPVTFTWTQSENNDNVKYTIDVSTQGGVNFDANIIHTYTTGVNPGSLSWNFAILYAGTYYWRVEAIVDDGSAPNNGEITTSSIFSFTMTLNPTLAQPYNGLTGVSVLPTLRWNTVPGAVSYKLYIDSNSTFTDPKIYEQNVGTDTFKTFTASITNFPLTNGLTYYWKVSALDNNGTEHFSSTYHFRVAPAFTVSQDSPTNGQEIQTTSVRLQWSIGHTASGLTFEIQYMDTTSAPSTEADWSGATSTNVLGSASSSFSTTISVVLGRTYYWRVLIKRTSTGEYVHYPSPTTYRYFVTVGGSTVTLTPNWPKDSVYIYTNNPRFNWVVNGYTGGLTYQIRYSTSDSVDGDGKLIGYDATSYPTNPVSFPSVQYLTLPDTLYPGRTFYWQVRAYYSTTAEYSDWSPVEDFVVNGPGTLEVPSVNYPINGVSVYTNTPRLDWVLSTAGTGLKYQVRYSTSSSTDGSGMLNGPNTTNYPSSIPSFSSDKYLTLPSLTPGTTYYWQVRSYSEMIDVLIDDDPDNGDAQAFSNWSSVEDFVTNGPGTLVVPTPNWPKDRIVVYSTAPILTWYLNPYSSGLEYDIDFATTYAGLDGNVDFSSTTMSYQVTGLTPGEIYFWRVRSRNSVSQNSAWSDTASFIVAGGTTATYAVANWPDNGTIVYTNRPELSWYLQGYNLGISGFEVKYRKGSAPVDWLTYSPASNDADSGQYTGLSASTFSKQIDVNLTYGANYYWAVYATGTTNFNPAGEGYFSIVGGPSATTINNNWPTDGSTVNSTSIRFSWTITGSTLGIVDYELVYSLSDVFDPNVTTTVTGITEQYKDVTGLQNGATYYWKVRARYADNTYTIYSSTTSFTIQQGSSIVIAQPLVGGPHNVVLTINSPTFSWYLPVPVNQSLKYELEYADNPYFTNSVKLQNLNTTHTVVNGLTPNKQYFWRVRSKSDDGLYSYYSNTGRFGIESTTDVNDPVENIPDRYALYQNYPNPFNPSTTIKFDLPEDSRVSLKIYNLLGQEVITIIDRQMMKAGRYSKDVNLANLSSGVYVYRLETNGFTAIKKMIMIK